MKVYIKNNLIDTDGGLYLKVDSLIEMNNTITSSNNITLRKVNVNPFRFDGFYNGNDRTCKTLFANDDIMRQT